MAETSTIQHPVNTRQVVHSGDVDLAVTAHGDPQNPTIILVHGYPDNSSVWNPVINYLHHHFHVVTYDVRGCGESSAPGWMWDYTLTKLSEDLQAVMRAVCPTQPVHLVAHDWGSIQTWESVTDHRLKARIASYTSISGPCLDHIGQWFRQGLSLSNRKALGEVLGQAVHSWYVAAFQLPLLAPSAWKLGLDKAWPGILKRMEGQDVETNGSQRKDGINGINLYRANMVPRLSNPRIRQTAVPVQLLVPTKDKFVTPPMVESCYPYVSNLWRRDVEAHHWVIQTHAEWVANCVAEFVEFADTGRETPSLAKTRVEL
ncbi:alpha/beta fold hydrolase [Limnobacter humi]|uniref:Alpha/beta fold hydrolase n=1 Tax=Limnobacter humi TaxID=1778671 RepID=A0ABT1WF20_9BURK|nr:alpha/beta fold hydrolase [Limnobacter humi]MCQ8896112.1 alpha/beta fold hydrolase [Limnobacter humi]